MTADPSIAATRRELDLERERLKESVQRLRGHVEQARRKPFAPSVAGVAVAALAGFLLAGGVHATVRLLGARQRRQRERQRRTVLRSLTR